ncbi:MAG: PaaI family thioesterase [Anaerolineae bacterium]
MKDVTEMRQEDADDLTRRTRTITWQDPMIGATAGREMTGLDYLQAIVRGELPPPPISALVGQRFESVERGRVVLSIEPAEYHYNPMGSVHGGVWCTILDSAMACAIHSMLPLGVTFTTLELKVNFLRPMTVDTGRVTCEGKVIHVGSRVATAEARLVDERGKLYGHATTTCIALHRHA